MLKLTDCNLHHHLVLLTLGNCLCVCSRPQIHQPCFFVRSIQTSDGQLFEHDHQSDYFLKAGFESATFSQHRLGLFGRPLVPVVDLVRVSFFFWLACCHLEQRRHVSFISEFTQRSRTAWPFFFSCKWWLAMRLSGWFFSGRAFALNAEFQWLISRLERLEMCWPVMPSRFWICSPQSKRPTACRCYGQGSKCRIIRKGLISASWSVLIYTDAFKWLYGRYDIIFSDFMCMYMYICIYLLDINHTSHMSLYLGNCAMRWTL